MFNNGILELYLNIPVYLYSAAVRDPFTFLNETPRDLFYRANHPAGTHYCPAIQQHWRKVNRFQNVTKERDRLRLGTANGDCWGLKRLSLLGMLWMQSLISSFETPSCSKVFLSALYSRPANISIYFKLLYFLNLFFFPNKLFYIIFFWLHQTHELLDIWCLQNQASSSSLPRTRYVFSKQFN